MALAHDGKSGRVVLKGFQRRCRDLFQRTILLLDRAERLADIFGAWRSSRFPSAQHVLFILAPASAHSSRVAPSCTQLRFRPIT